MKIFFLLLGLIVSAFFGGCIPLISFSSGFQECTYAVACRVIDEKGCPIRHACLFYGYFLNPSVTFFGESMCRVATANEEGLIHVDAVELEDARGLTKRWAPQHMFIVAPGYAPVLYHGQTEVVLIKTEEFEGVFYDGRREDYPYARFMGADFYSRIPLKVMQVWLKYDVVTNGPGCGMSGEIARREAYFREYERSSPFFVRDRKTNYRLLLVFALYDHQYQLAKRLRGSQEQFNKAETSGERKIKARDYLEVRMNPENMVSPSGDAIISVPYK